MNDGLGKKAEQKIKEWLDRPDEGYCLDRLPDQMNGFIGSKNPCDFTLYKYPYKYYLESKATTFSRFDFSMITDFQYKSLLEKSKITGVYGLVIVLFASYKRAFVLDIQTIDHLKNCGIKSINIDKIDKWDFEYCEIQTVPNSRKLLLDYSGNIEMYVPILRW